MAVAACECYGFFPHHSESKKGVKTVVSYACILKLLTWANVGLEDEPSSPFSLSTLVGLLGGLDIILEENMSSKALPTDGRVL